MLAVALDFKLERKNEEAEDVRRGEAGNQICRLIFKLGHVCVCRCRGLVTASLHPTTPSVIIHCGPRTSVVEYCACSAQRRIALMIPPNVLFISARGRVGSSLRWRLKPRCRARVGWSASRPKKETLDVRCLRLRWEWARRRER